MYVYAIWSSIFEPQIWGQKNISSIRNTRHEKQSLRKLADVIYHLWLVRDVC